MQYTEFCTENESHEQIILKPLTYEIEYGTKNVWLELCKSFNCWLELSDEDLQLCESSWKRLVYGQLLFDDIRTNTVLRNGRPTALYKYKTSACLTAFLYEQAIYVRDLSKRQFTARILEMFVEHLALTCVARRREIDWQRRVYFPTAEEYIAMAVKKSTGVFCSCIKILQLTATKKVKLNRLVELVSLFLHVAEDLDYFFKGGVLSSTKFTLPIVHAMNTSDYVYERVAGIMKTNVSVPEVNSFVSHLIEENGSYEYTRDVLCRLQEEIVNEINKLGGNPELVDLVDKIMHNLQFTKNDTVDKETRTGEMDFSKILQMLRTNSAKTVDPRERESILKPIKYSMDRTRQTAPGFKDALEQIFNYWLQIPPTKLEIIYEIFLAYIDIGTIWDDVLDNSYLRRGVIAAPIIYGLANAINYVVFSPICIIEKLFLLNEPKVFSVYLEGVPESVAAVAMEAYWRDNLICPTEKEVIKISMQLNSGFWMIMMNIMKLFRTTTKDPTKFTKAFLTMYQLKDSVKNLTEAEFQTSKGFLDDVAEGKFSFPVVYALRNCPDVREELIAILKQRVRDLPTRKRFVQLLEKCGALDYTNQKIKMFVDITMDEVDLLGGNPNAWNFIHENAYRYHIV